MNLSLKTGFRNSNDVTDAAELPLHHERLNAMEVCSVQDLDMLDPAEDLLETLNVKGLKAAYLCLLKYPCLTTIQQGSWLSRPQLWH